MAESWIVLQEVTSLFFFVAVGFSIRRFGIIQEEGSQAITSILNYVTMPAMLITSMHLDPTPEVLKNTAIMLGLTIILVGFAFLLSEILGSLAQLNLIRRHAFQAGFTFGNVAFLGFPVLQALYGSQGLYYAAIFTLGHNFLLYTLGAWLLKRHQESRVTWRLIGNPTTISIVLALLINLTRTKIPHIVWDPLTQIGAITIPLALFLVGATLAEASLAVIFKEPLTYKIASGKLLLLPLLTLAILKDVPLDPVIKTVAVLEMGMPVAAVLPVLARFYNSDYTLLSNSVAISTIFSLGSLPVLIWLVSG